MPIVGAVERKGNVVARVIDSVDAATLNGFVREAVSEKVSLLCTDQWVGYQAVSTRNFRTRRRPRQGPVRCRRDPHQTIEGFWSIFKRGVVGTFHKVSAQVPAALRRRVPVPL